MMELFYLFMVYAIIGWLWETPYVSIGQKKFVNRGFLRGPYIPIYGLACITIIYSIRLLPDFEINVITVIFVILFVSIVSAVWEYGTSWILEKLFKMRWWDYSSHKFNLNGRVCLDYAILFGIGGFLLWYFINPLVLSLYNSLDDIAIYVILVAFYALFIIDSVYTLRDLIQIRTVLIKLELIKDELSVKYDEIINQLNESKYDTITQINDFISSIKNKGGEEYNKMKDSLKMTVNSIQDSINNSRANTSRFFAKFPRTSFSLKDMLKQNNSKRTK